MTAGRAFLVLFLSGIAGSFPAAPARAGDDPPAPGPATPPGTGAAAAQESPEIEALRHEMHDTWLRVQKDHAALRGEKSAETIAALAKVVETAQATRGESAGGAIPGLWMEAGLLGPEVAGRLAARRVECAAKAAAEGRPETVGESLGRAAALVFPEATMADNWDRHFLDLEVVRRWVKAGGAGGASTPGPKAADPPEPPKPPAAAPDPADMILVPKGDLAVPEQRGFGWRNPDQKAEKRIVKPFYIDRTEVSCAAYAAFLREVKDARVRERILPSGWKLDDKGLPEAPKGSETLPVSGIPCEGAVAFAASLGKRLPSEDEWERAARGDDGLRFPWGNEWQVGRAVAVDRKGPAPVGSTPGDASPFGVLDLCGNVSELCATQPDGKPLKGVPKATDQVVRRGGSYGDTVEESASDWRYVIGGTTRSPKVGFRCAMDEREFEKRFGRK